MNVFCSRVPSLQIALPVAPVFEPSTVTQDGVRSSRLLLLHGSRVGTVPVCHSLSAHSAGHTCKKERETQFCLWWILARWHANPFFRSQGVQGQRFLYPPQPLPIPHYCWLLPRVLPFRSWGRGVTSCHLVSFSLALTLPGNLEPRLLLPDFPAVF